MISFYQFSIQKCFESKFKCFDFKRQIFNELKNKIIGQEGER